MDMANIFLVAHRTEKPDFDGSYAVEQECEWRMEQAFLGMKEALYHCATLLKDDELVMHGHGMIELRRQVHHQIWFGDHPVTEEPTPVEGGKDG